MKDLLTSNGWKPLADLQGDEAAGKYAETADAEKEVTVECHYTGKNKMTVRLGVSPDGHGYGYLDDSENGKRLITSGDLDVQTLFQNCVSYLAMRQGFVNSDPLSPDYFDIEPELEEVVGSLNSKFGVEVQPGM